MGAQGRGPGPAFTEEDFSKLLGEKLSCQQMAARVHDLIMRNEKVWHQPAWGTFFGIKKFNRRKAKSGLIVAVAPTCSTTGCVAGWTTQLAGDHMVIDSGDARRLEQSYADHAAAATSVITKDGTVRGISERGAQLLCLESTERSWLFGADRHLKEVLYALEELAAGKRLSYTYGGSIPAGWRPVALEPDPRKTTRKVVRTTTAKKTTAAGVKAKVR